MSWLFNTMATVFYSIFMNIMFEHYFRKCHGCSIQWSWYFRLYWTNKVNGVIYYISLNKYYITILLVIYVYICMCIVCVYYVYIYDIFVFILFKHINK